MTMMHVIIQGDWWYARNRNKPNGPEGYIPSNYIAKVKSLESEPWVDLMTFDD